MLVRSLSYGIESKMVRRGPQAVQLMNGCRYRLSDLLYNYYLHLSNIEISGETKIIPFSRWLSMISNP